MRGIKSLSGGLLVGAIIAVTVFSALVLSVRSQAASISELPVPTVTLQLALSSPAASPTPASMVTQVALNATPSTILTPSGILTPSVILTPSATLPPTPTRCPIPSDWQRYIVGPFDTLLSIAQRFNLTSLQLVVTNCLDRPSVTVGQTLYVPGFKPTPTAVPCYPPFNWARYIVQPGDTLSSIAARYNISVYALMRANCLTTTYIYYGQLLYVPAIGPIVIFTPTPIIPTLTPTPPIGTLTLTLPPTILPTTPVITGTPGPSSTPGPTVLPSPMDTPTPTNMPGLTDTPTPIVTAAPTTPLPSTTPEPLPTATTAPPTPVPNDTPAPLPTIATAPPTPVPNNTPEPPPVGVTALPTPLPNNTPVPPPAGTIAP